MKMPDIPDDGAKFSMAPMIDMVFLLLIFFMCASHLSVSQSKELEIPTASRAVVPRDRPDRIIINVTIDGDVFLGQQPVELEDLRRMATEHRKIDPAIKVYLRGDQNAEFRIMQRVMNAMAEVGIDDFIFGTHVPQ